MFIAPVKENSEGIVSIFNGDKAYFRFVNWRTPVSSVVVEAAGSGKVEIYIDNDNNFIGELYIENGSVVKTSLKGVTGYHEIILKFECVSNLEIYSLCFK